jgi:death-on-curing protein
MNDGEPEFLTRAEVEYLHAESLRRFGGSTGTREPGLVDSALGAAMNTWHCGRGDVFDVAASDAFHLARSAGVSRRQQANRSDGRTGFFCARTDIKSEPTMAESTQR